MEFTQSYGASGDQSRAVESGLPADIVALSLAPDVDKLVEPGIVAADWAQDRQARRLRHQLGRRLRRAQGQPQEHQDLGRPDQAAASRSITPEPVHLGRREVEPDGRLRRPARAGQVAEEALAYLKALLENTPVQDKSAREALATFAGGKGDVLLAYENEAITAQKAEVELDYVIPDETILIQNPAAVTEDSKSPEKAKAFLDYLAHARGAEDLRRQGLPQRHPGPGRRRRRTRRPKTLFKIDKFGGWDKVNAEFFDPDTGSVAKIEQDLGVSTAK